MDCDNTCFADALMNMIGVEIAKMHYADVIHGDLTTSNMMLRRKTSDLVRDSTQEYSRLVNVILRFL